MSWRGTCLIIEKSHLYMRGRVLRHPGTLQTVTTQPSQSAAERYCRRNGYSWMKPVPNVSLAQLEERI